MLKTWKALQSDYILRRTIELHDHLLPCDREYTRLREVYRQAMDQLIARLDLDQYQLFLDFESAATSLVNRSDELVYRQGLIDGVRLGRCVEEIKSEKGKE